ncbi:GNAT family N-acetyltransferase [Paucibacter sp. Y2R2-4]|uniref:GNAT family N-acetyltransferase n=1 Tax=Paucibacter sp. Y2R2-4 TaxID=2893553 RepID=UPI0021E41EB0|nr:GNAT family N-acetyltransferase [Paucibacter sp. Y2R2-4]MCV2351355.1 GNAT family N-acetyltransferase [Paucibacter sp. Y2R2-4]
MKTERLLLRWFAPGDEAHVLAQLQEDSWKLNINDPGVRELEAARFWMQEKLLKPYWGAGLGLWLVARSSDGVAVGMCGLLQRDYLPVPDIGYAFLPSFWGQGYAREAAQACRDYGREVLGEPRLMATTATFNEASGRVLEAIGMQHVDTRQFEGVEGLSKVYATGPALEPRSEEQQISDLLQRFFRVFNNQDGRLPALAALPYMLLPQALICRADDGGLQQMTLQQFVEPRYELLMGGRLQQFDESITEQRLDRQGRVAQAWLRYRKAGVLDGQAFEAFGQKTVQLVKTGRRWQIAAVAWEDLC